MMQTTDYGAGTFASITGYEEFDERLSYLMDQSAKRIGKSVSVRMSGETAKGIRRFIPRSLARSSGMQGDRGIGSRGIRQRKGAVYLAKAGISVGRAAKRANRFEIKNTGHANAGPQRQAFRFNDKTRKVTRATGRKFAKFTRQGRKGVGVDARNLHWFGGGTEERFTGEKKQWFRGIRQKMKTGNRRRRLGRINKATWGGFVQRGFQATELIAMEQGRRKLRQLIDEETAKVRRM